MRYKRKKGEMFKIYTVNKSNNGTPLEQYFIYGTYEGQKGQIIPLREKTYSGARLNETEVWQILGLRGKHPAKVIGAIYEVSPKTIEDIWYGRTWKNVSKRKTQTNKTHKLGVGKQDDGMGAGGGKTSRRDKNAAALAEVRLASI